MNDPSPTDRRALGLLSAGHLASDFCQGAVPALVPFLIAQRGYTYSDATALVLAATVGSALAQPLFGLWADRARSPWLMPAGLALGGTGIALAGVAPGFELTLATVALSGLGVAAFHPEAARLANYASGDRRATGMSHFSVGGNAGFALGPLITTPVVLGQEYLPSRLGLASGVTLGLAIGVGGLGAAALGLVADGAGLPAAMTVIAVLPLPMFALALTLPRERVPALR